MTGALVIVPGHHQRSQGAISAAGLAEWPINYVLARQIVEHLGPRGRLHVHSAPKGATASTILRRSVAAINAMHPAAVVELHWNSVPPRNPSGQTLIHHSTSFGLHWRGSKHGRALAMAASAACARELGTRDYEPVVKANGWPMLRDTSAPSILLETHNGANPDHHEAYLEAVQSGRLGYSLARAIRTTVAAWS